MFLLIHPERNPDLASAFSERAVRLHPAAFPVIPLHPCDSVPDSFGNRHLKAGRFSPDRTLHLGKLHLFHIAPTPEHSHSDQEQRCQKQGHNTDQKSFLQIRIVQPNHRLSPVHIGQVIPVGNLCCPVKNVMVSQRSIHIVILRPNDNPIFFPLHLKRDGAPVRQLVFRDRHGMRQKPSHTLIPGKAVKIGKIQSNHDNIVIFDRSEKLQFLLQLVYLSPALIQSVQIHGAPTGIPLRKKIAVQHPIHGIQQRIAVGKKHGLAHDIQKTADTGVLIHRNAVRSDHYPDSCLREPQHQLLRLLLIIISKTVQKHKPVFYQFFKTVVVQIIRVPALHGRIVHGDAQGRPPNADGLIIADHPKLLPGIQVKQEITLIFRRQLITHCLPGHLHLLQIQVAVLHLIDADQDGIIPQLQAPVKQVMVAPCLHSLVQHHNVFRRIGRLPACAKGCRHGLPIVGDQKRPRGFQGVQIHAGNPLRGNFPGFRQQGILIDFRHPLLHRSR